MLQWHLVWISINLLTFCELELLRAQRFKKLYYETRLAYNKWVNKFIPKRLTPGLNVVMIFLIDSNVNVRN
jgi:hypothetical protein